MIVFCEGRDEFLRHPVMSKCVYIECKSHIFLCCIEDLFAAGDAGVVNYYCWVTDVFADFGGDGGESAGRGDVAFVVVDIVRYPLVSN